jgi:hypothetical protein
LEILGSLKVSRTVHTWAHRFLYVRFPVIPINFHKQPQKDTRTQPASVRAFRLKAEGMRDVESVFKLSNVNVTIILPGPFSGEYVLQFADKAAVRIRLNLETSLSTAEAIKLGTQPLPPPQPKALCTREPTPTYKTHTTRNTREYNK